MIDFEQLQALLSAGQLPAAGAVLVPSNMRVESLERFAEAPTRHRGTYHADHLEDYCAYLAANANLGTFPHCFISVGTEPSDATSAVTIFDYGFTEMPQWREHNAILRTCATDAARSLFELIDRPLTQKVLLDFIDDYAPNCAFFRQGDQRIATDIARTEFANMTIDSVRTLNSKRDDFQRERSALEKLSMGNGLPNRLVFSCAPWRGFSCHDLRVRLSAAEVSSGIAITASLVGFDEIKADLVAELIAKTKAASEDITVLRGTFEAKVVA
jgi:uncharacterized protein YfdQ (DUF2303 family)